MMKSTFMGLMMQHAFIPNSFQLPNAIVDDLMRQLSPNAFKLYVLIVRKTTGWGKSSDRISITQFMEFSGIKKRDTVISALAELERFGLVLPCKKVGKVNEYFLNKIPETSPENGDYPKNGTSPENGDWGSPENGDWGSPENGDTQNTTKTKTTKTKTNNSSSTKSKQLNLLAQHGIDGQLAEDFLTLRKTKHAPLTETAINGILREAKKANLSPAQAVTICVERNWQGFKADWLFKDSNRLPTQQSIKSIPHHTQGGAFLAKDIW